MVEVAPVGAVHVVEQLVTKGTRRAPQAAEISRDPGLVGQFPAEPSRGRTVGTQLDQDDLQVLHELRLGVAARAGELDQAVEVGDDPAVRVMIERAPARIVLEHVAPSLNAELHPERIVLVEELLGGPGQFAVPRGARRPIPATIEVLHAREPAGGTHAVVLRQQRGTPGEHVAVPPRAGVEVRQCHLTRGVARRSAQRYQPRREPGEYEFDLALSSHDCNSSGAVRRADDPDGALRQPRCRTD